MRIIIPGGSGFLGTALSKRLIQTEHEVCILTRNPGQRMLPEGVREVSWDGQSSRGWGELIENTDVIINLAGATIGHWPWSAARKELIRISRANAGRAIVHAIEQAKNKPQLVVQISGIGYYGPQDDCPLDETAAAGNDFLAKVAVEWEESTAAVESMGVRRVIARTGLVLSNQGGVMTQLKLPFNLFAGGPLGSGNQVYSWIHLADEVEAIRFLIEHSNESGPFNLTAPNAVTMAEFGRTLAKTLRRPYWLPAPGFLLKLVLGEMSTLILDGQRCIPSKLHQAGFQFRYPSLKDALEDLFHPR